MKSILFVCLGNICRSPLAEGIAKHYVQTNDLNIHIDSAGTGSWHIGEAPCDNSITVASHHGIDISQQRARQVKKTDFNDFDMIIALDQSNYDDLKDLGATNLYKLGSFGYANENVPDPYFFPGFEGFEKVFTMIESCVHTLLESKHA